MMKSNLHIGLLNEILKGLRIVNGEVTEEDVQVIAGQILKGIKFKITRSQFVDYVFENYSIQL